MVPLTPTDISIDALIMIVWFVAMARTLYTLLYTETCVRMRVLMSLFLGMGAIYTNQAMTTIFTGERATSWVWDLFNALAVFAVLVVVTRWKEGKTVEWDH